MKEKGITNVRAIADAFVPVIKIEYENIEVCSSNGEGRGKREKKGTSYLFGCVLAAGTLSG